MSQSLSPTMSPSPVSFETVQEKTVPPISFWEAVMNGTTSIPLAKLWLRKHDIPLHVLWDILTAKDEFRRAKEKRSKFGWSVLRITLILAGLALICGIFLVKHGIVPGEVLCLLIATMLFIGLAFSNSPKQLPPQDWRDCIPKTNNCGMSTCPIHVAGPTKDYDQLIIHDCLALHKTLGSNEIARMSERELYQKIEEILCWKALEILLQQKKDGQERASEVLKELVAIYDAAKVFGIVDSKGYDSYFKKAREIFPGQFAPAPICKVPPLPLDGKPVDPPPTKQNMEEVTGVVRTRSSGGVAGL